MKRAIAAVAAALLFAGCSGASPATAPQSSPSPSFTCEEVADDLADSLFDEEYGFTMIDAAAVRSPGHAKAWYLAVLAVDDAGDDVFGIWATTALKMPAAVRAVDGFAREFSSFPDGRNEGFSLTDDAAVAAKNCVR